MQRDAHVGDYRIHLAVRRRLEYELEPYAALDELSEVIMLDLGCIASRVQIEAVDAYSLAEVFPAPRSGRLVLQLDDDAPPWDFSY